MHPDASLNLTALADRLAALGTSQIATFTLPANPDYVGDAAVLRLDQEKATALLSFFGGQPPAASASTTVAPPTTNASGSALAAGSRGGADDQPADRLRPAPDLRTHRHRPRPVGSLRLTVFVVGGCASSHELVGAGSAQGSSAASRLPPSGRGR